MEEYSGSIGGCDLQHSNTVEDTCATEGKKRLFGQFYTTTNPFTNEAFVRWFDKTPKDGSLLEPFAGANNIVWMLRDLEITRQWTCFDIDPKNGELENTAPEFTVQYRDTLKDFPTGFDVAITNPPYLAKNSATRRGLEYSGGDFDDVYKNCLNVMLKNVRYVAAIIPESFITSGLFVGRLHTVVSLTCRMFDDTEVPVCLALFTPESESLGADDFEIWSGNRKLGRWKDLSSFLPVKSKCEQNWKFNCPSGAIGLFGVDSNNSGGSISFVQGDLIPSESVKNTSRAITRISLDGMNVATAKKVIAESNKILKSMRVNTHDVFMTSFKGLRDDGKYRRRLDFEKARAILDMAFENISSRPKDGL